MTIAIVLGLTVASYAQGGLFRRGADGGESPDAGYSLNSGGRAGNGAPILPIHEPEGGNGDEPAAPLGSGLAVLLGLGGAYLVAKKRDED